MNKKFAIIVEYIWLIMAVAAFILSIVYTFKIGVKNSYMLYIVTAVSLIMYYIRRTMRKSK